MLLSRLPNGDPEIFASVQGEGATTGVPSVFIRLSECNLKCTWCFVPETPVLLADWTWRALGDVAVGDRVMAVSKPEGRGRHQQLVAAEVIRSARRRAATVIVNDEVRCTPDHRFWLTGKDELGEDVVHSGWRSVDRATTMRCLFVTDPVAPTDSTYERGWLAGMADGDGCFWTLSFRRGYRRFRLALTEPTLLDRAEAFAARAGWALRRGTHAHEGFKGRGSMRCLWLTRDEDARAFERWLGTDIGDESWAAGYLGGLMDAEGSYSCGVLRVAQDAKANGATRDRFERVLDRLAIEHSPEASGYYIKRRGGNQWRALTLARPAKPSLLAGAFGHHPNHSRVIRRVDPVGRIEEVVTLSTSAGSFIAGGYVVKNCDTKYTWDWERYDRKTEVVELEVERVVERARVLAASGVRNIVLTGGEPLLQQVELGRLAGELRRDGFRLEVETNGTIQPSAAVAEAIDQWNVSPKLETSDNPLRARRRAAPLSWFAAQPNAWFKFVVTSDADLVEIDELVTSLSVPSTQVILMPEGTDASSQLAGGRWLADACRERGYRLGSRLHVLLWGADRGR